MNIEEQVKNLVYMTRIVNNMAKDGCFSLCYTQHSTERMGTRTISPADILFVLKTGRIVEYQGKGKHPGENKIHKYKIVGIYAGDDSGRELGLVILVEVDRFKNPAIKVKDIITTMWQD